MACCGGAGCCCGAACCGGAACGGGPWTGGGGGRIGAWGGGCAGPGGGTCPVRCGGCAHGEAGIATVGWCAASRGTGWVCSDGTGPSGQAPRSGGEPWGLATISSGGHTGSCSACSTSPTSVTNAAQPAMLRPQYRPGAALDPPAPLAGQRAGQPVVAEGHLGGRVHRHRAAPGAAHLDRHTDAAPAARPDRYRDGDVDRPVGRIRPGYQREPVHRRIPGPVADRAGGDRLARLGQYRIVAFDPGRPRRGTPDERPVQRHRPGVGAQQVQPGQGTVQHRLGHLARVGGQVKPVLAIERQDADRRQVGYRPVGGEVARTARGRRRVPPDQPAHHGPHLPDRRGRDDDCRPLGRGPGQPVGPRRAVGRGDQLVELPVRRGRRRRHVGTLGDQGVTAGQYRCAEAAVGGRELISADAHLSMPHHGALDRVVEGYLGSARIGTTGRGIGPAYGDKVARVGIRVQDLLDPGILRKKLEMVLREKNQVLFKVYNRKAIDVGAVVDEYLGYAGRLRPYIADTRLVLAKALENGETVLLEGAQATLLDVDHGTYPFVTSSNPTAGGACVGSGIPPTRISQVIGVIKAYTTRVGAGPFPTELFDDNGAHLATMGVEFGTTTSRPRRCGWCDAVVGRYAVRVNGITDLVVTKLDVLSGLPKVPICVGYEGEGQRGDEMPLR